MWLGRFKAYLHLVRVPYIVMVDLLCVLIMLTLQQGFYNLNVVARAVLAVSLIIAASAAINDYFDVDSDEVTHPERAIPSGQISLTQAAAFSALTFGAGLAVAYTINFLIFEIAALNAVLFVLYPPVFKRLSGFLSNLVMGYLGASIALFAGAAVFHAINVASLSFVGMLAGGTIGLNVLKDVLTVDGDFKAGYPTLALQRGVRIAAIVGGIFLVVSAVLSPVPYLVGAAGTAFLIPIVVWTGIGLITAISLFREPEFQNVRKLLAKFTGSFPYLVLVASISYALFAAFLGF